MRLNFESRHPERKFRVLPLHQPAAGYELDSFPLRFKENEEKN